MTMAQNGKQIGFLASVDVFADSMSEQYMNGGTRNGMLIIASDGNQTARILDGNDDTLLDALSTVLYSDEGLFKLLEDSLALARVAILKDHQDDDTD